MKKYLLLFIAMGLFFTSCDPDDNIIPDIEPEQEDPKTAADYPVQNFMWQVMNSYYFWQADVPDLADSKFENTEDPEYVAFLASEEDPSNFFYRDLCNNHVRAVNEASAVDRFSGAVNNYKDLVNSLQGISKSNGLQFGLSLFGDNREVFGYVEYIIKDSDAATKEIKRGDIFTTVDGTQLYFVDENDNNLDLLDKDTYTLGMADIIDRTITPNNKEVTLTKEEGLAENPILLSKVIEQNGTKVGYIMYNGFLADYDDELNEVFGNLDAEGISELILDFRYNGGGRVTSAIQIASAVYETNTDELFLKARYNDKIQSTFDPGDGEDNFTDKTFDSKTALNTLGLKRVFVITTIATASASELVMNGLEPYVDVVQVGTKTRGKNEFSNTFVDDAENNWFYNPNRENNINPDNQWGIQPLLGRNENADGFSDYTGGLLPDHELEEDIANMGVLGEDSDPLLALTLSVIDGATAKRNFTPEYPVNFVTSSKLRDAKSHGMVMDGLIKPFKSAE